MWNHEKNTGRGAPWQRHAQRQKNIMLVVSCLRFVSLTGCPFGLTSADRVQFTSGSKFLLLSQMTMLLFECLQAGNTPNPSDIFLNEAQKAAAFAFGICEQGFFQ